MELDTRLDRASYHWMSPDLRDADRAAMLVEVTAPPLPDRERAAATHLVVVLDRSGSMGGGRLDHAKRALSDVVDRLTPRDSFGLVVFDGDVEVVVPAGPVSDPERIKRAIDGVRPRGSTDLGAGLLRGLQEARRPEVIEGVRVLLISDGHANRGVTDPDVLGTRAAELVDVGVTTSTLGVGLGYDEHLLDVIAREGSGNHYFAEEADAASTAIGAECGELLGHRYLQCRLTVTCGNGVADVRVLNDTTIRPFDGGVTVEMGGLAPEQTRSVVLRFGTKQAPKPGRRKVATVRLEWVLADDLSEHAHSQTVWTKVAAPGDKPGRIDRDVVAEVVFQQVQRIMRRATEAVQRGDLAAARRRFDRAVALIRRHWTEIPRERQSELEAEIDVITQALANLERAAAMDDGFAIGAVSKSMTSDMAYKSRSRDRRDRRR